MFLVASGTSINASYEPWMATQRAIEHLGWSMLAAAVIGVGLWGCCSCARMIMTKVRPADETAAATDSFDDGWPFEPWPFEELVDVVVRAEAAVGIEAIELYLSDSHGGRL
jgi:hypothetical protein